MFTNTYDHDSSYWILDTDYQFHHSVTLQPPLLLCANKRTNTMLLLPQVLLPAIHWIKYRFCLRKKKKYLPPVIIVAWLSFAFNPTALWINAALFVFHYSSFLFSEKEKNQYDGQPKDRATLAWKTRRMKVRKLCTQCAVSYVFTNPKIVVC